MKLPLSSIYSESYLPVRFFLGSIIVHCPSCNEKARITTDIPPVWNQRKIEIIFNDSGTFNSEYLYRWNNARFLCPGCQKNFETDNYHIIETWRGPVECIAETICPNCEIQGYKERLFARKKYKSKINLLNEIKLICPKCQTSTLLKWRVFPIHSASIPIDPIFGLKLFGVTQFKNEILWVYNTEHLKHIQAYIKAMHRKKNFKIEYANYKEQIKSRSVVLSFSEQLPQVFKSEANRIPVLKELNKLNQLLTCGK